MVVKLWCVNVTIKFRMKGPQKANLHQLEKNYNNKIKIVKRTVRLIAI